MIYTLDKINEMADGDEDFIISVISVFLEEVPEDLAALENAVASEDFDQIGKMAHKIKPNVDLLGMEQTKENAYALEKLGKAAGSLEDIKTRFPLLKRDIEQVMVELHNDFNI